MKKFLILIVVAVVLSAMAQQVVIKYIIDYPLRPIPGDNDAWLLEDANEPAGVHQYVHTTTKGIMSYASLHQNLLFPNGTGVFTNDGAGNVGFTLSLQLTEVDAQNFFPTNLFTGITNAPLLSTDGNGKIQNGTPLAATNVTYIAGANLTFTTNADGSIVIASSATITVTTVTNNTFVNTNTFISTSNAFFNIAYITNLYSDTITNNTFVNTNVVILSGKANINTLIITNTTFVNNPTNLAATASTVAYWNSDKTLGNVANAYGFLTNNGSGGVAFTSAYPQGDGSAITNLTYQYKTNAVTTGVLVFGQAYRTNINADITINSLTLGSSAMYESMVLLVTNSDTAVHKITWPSGVFSGGVAAVSWITNGYWNEVLVDHFATLYTNAVTKN